MKKSIHIHLDPIGGISGDMFISSMIDAHPSLKTTIKGICLKIMKGIKITITKSKNTRIKGTNFSVQNINKDDKNHRSFNDIKKIIENSFLTNNTKTTAIKLFQILANAESKIHGTQISKVEFHEIGAWDSIIDNIIAAEIIEYFNKNFITTWSCAPIPIGKGTVHTAHGYLSIPAPATALLLKGLPILEDGIEGERTTPTGAAIINYLNPFPDIASATNKNLKILKQGIGIGCKKFKNIPNILRILIFEHTKSPIKNIHNEVVTKISFDIDDQSPEDLNLSLNTIKKEKGIIDITQTPLIGKKGRISINVKILCRVEKANNIIRVIFNETSTIGLRTAIIARQTLNRHLNKVSYFNIKKTKRPSGKTSKKVESDDLKNYSYKNRKILKSKLEK